MALEVQDFEHEEGSTNMGGLSGHVYVCPASDIATFTVTKDPTTGKRTLTALTCKTGKKFSQVYVTPDTGFITGKGQGGKDAMSFANKIGWWCPTLSGENLALKEALNNGGYIVIGKDQDGPCVIGSPDYPAYTTGGDVNSGKESKDKRGIDYEMEAPSPFPPVRFGSSLTVPLTPAV